MYFSSYLALLSKSTKLEDEGFFTRFGVEARVWSVILNVGLYLYRSCCFIESDEGVRKFSFSLLVDSLVVGVEFTMSFALIILGFFSGTFGFDAWLLVLLTLLLLLLLFIVTLLTLDRFDTPSFKSPYKIVWNFSNLEIYPIYIFTLTLK